MGEKIKFTDYNFDKSNINKSEFSSYIPAVVAVKKRKLHTRPEKTDEVYNKQRHI